MQDSIENRRADSSSHSPLYVHEVYDRSPVGEVNKMGTRLSLLMTFCLLSNIGFCAAAEPTR